MREARIKVPSDEGLGVYHAMTRTVNRERLFDNGDKEILRRQIWQVAEYTGVEVITYAILANHFHVLVRVPQRTDLPDAELLRRYAVLYPSPTKYKAHCLEVIKSELAANGPEAVAWRRRQLALMFDLSQFMKLVKQRFSIYFNKHHGRVGTLWAERFKSILLEPRKHVVETVAAYIDLNAVRAGLVRDPKDYRFCSYAEAVAGSTKARCGLASIFGQDKEPWDQVQTGYRLLLFGTGSGEREHDVVLAREAFARVLDQGGRLSLATVLRCRLRYFTDGAVLGSRTYVRRQLLQYNRRCGGGDRMEPRPLPDIGVLGLMCTMKKLRTPAAG